jgi:hypothetical protein
MPPWRDAVKKSTGTTLPSPLPLLCYVINILTEPITDIYNVKQNLGRKYS